VVVKHVSDSVGLELLNLTYRDLLQTTQNVSYRFIDLSVRLESFEDFHKNDTLELSRLVRKNPYASRLLQHLVWHYFYIYPAPLELKKSICDRLGIQLRQKLQYLPKKRKRMELKKPR
jgi:hypothetical protein